MGVIQISERLRAVASLVTKGNILADIGTDHGYVPIYLIQREIIPRAIAMDINAGPLERAREHISAYGLNDKVETRLSDGAHALEPGEAESILIAGMGGALAMRIIAECPEVFARAAEVILQPQSEIPLVRKFLMDNGYNLQAENMILEDGKFYPMMRVIYEPDGACDPAYNPTGTGDDESNTTGDISYMDVGLRYGAMLLSDKNEVLLKYLDKERDTYTDIYRRLQVNGADRNEGRIKEIEYIIQCNTAAHMYYKGE
jgi:tRNA (adenine22-N1)-methyltransferase